MKQNSTSKKVSLSEMANSISKLSDTSVVSEDNQYSKIISLGKDVVDSLRKQNKNLDSELKDPIYKFKGIYAKGGAARLALQLYDNRIEYKYDVVRDKDYVYISKDYGDAYKEVRDFWINNSYEDRMEIVSSIESYLTSRDFSANEVLLRPDALIFSRRALRDISKKVINPKLSSYKDVYSDGSYNISNALEIDPRTTSRLLLFAARYNYKINPKFIINIESLDTFLILVALIKSFELNIEDKFFELCKEYDLTEGNNSLDDWLMYLMKLHYNFTYASKYPKNLVNVLASDYDKAVNYIDELEDDSTLKLELFKMKNLNKYSDEEYIKKYLKKY
jgi:hypothetical protein